MIYYLSAKDFDLQSLSFSNRNIKKNAPCSILLVKANWCGFCVRYLPEFEELSKKHKSVNFLVVESDDNRQLLDQWANLVNPVFKVDSFPTTVLYDANGHPVKTFDRSEIDSTIQNTIS